MAPCWRLGSPPAAARPRAWSLNTWLTLVLAMPFGAAAGAFDGVLVIRLRIDAFIVTLATYIATNTLAPARSESREGRLARPAPGGSRADRRARRAAGTSGRQDQ